MYFFFLKPIVTKFHKPGRTRTKETYLLTVLGARSQGVDSAVLPLKSPGKDLFQASISPSPWEFPDL